MIHFAINKLSQKSKTNEIFSVCSVIFLMSFNYVCESVIPAFIKSPHLRNYLQLFLYCTSACAKFSQFPPLLECLYLPQLLEAAVLFFQQHFKYVFTLPLSSASCKVSTTSQEYQIISCFHSDDTSLCKFDFGKKQNYCHFFCQALASVSPLITRTWISKNLLTL